MNYYETNEEIYFYSLKNNKYACFSNFYNCEFIDINNIKFKNSEQYYVFYKCFIFDKENDKLLNAILNENMGKNIKKLGKDIKNFDEKVWNEHCYNVMKNGLIYKFSQNEKLKKKLLNTKNKIIYESSFFDKKWGIGFSVENAKNTNKELFGENLLGKCLMEVRELLNDKKYSCNLINISKEK